MERSSSGSRLQHSTAPILVVVAGMMLGLVVFYLWLATGGLLPTSRGLRIGMSMEEAKSVAGPPSQIFRHPNGKTLMIYTRPFTHRWFEMDFDAGCRLAAFRYDEF